jgi:membrane protein YdbS with pleckstrin-like domain
MSRIYLIFTLLTGSLIIGSFAGYYFQKALRERKVLKITVSLIFGIVAILMILYSKKFSVSNYTLFLLIAIVCYQFIVPARVRKKRDTVIEKVIYRPFKIL